MLVLRPRPEDRPAQRRPEVQQPEAVSVTTDADLRELIHLVPTPDLDADLGPLLVFRVPNGRTMGLYQFRPLGTVRTVRAALLLGQKHGAGSYRACQLDGAGEEQDLFLFSVGRASDV